MEQITAEILLIDSDTSSNVRISDYLKTFAYRIEIAETRQKALRKLHAKTFDLILLRSILPDMEECVMLDQIKSDPTFTSIPILMLLETEEAELVETCLEKGAEDVLYKPVHLELLRKRLENCSYKKQVQDQLALYLEDYRTAQKLANDLTEVILPIGIALSRIRNVDRLLERILQETKAVCNADGGTLYLREGRLLKFAIMLNDSLHIAISRNDDPTLFPPPLPLYDEMTGVPNHHNVATSSALLGLSINISDIDRVKNFDFSGMKIFDQQYGYSSKVSLTVPLKDHNGDVFGVLQLINPQDPQTGAVIPFDAYTQQVAEALASLAALVLNNQLLLERQKELLRFEDELKIGRQIQTSFLPENIPQPSGWEIVARLKSAHTISGDFYDVFMVDQQRRLCFVIADICDKGVGAALFMVLIRTLIRAFSEYSMDGQTPLQSVIEFTNDYIIHNHYTSNMFATLFIGMLNPATGLLSYVNSGHLAPIVKNSDGVKTQLVSTSPVIGAFPEVVVNVRQITLEPGDILLAYTDGITDARDPNGQFFTKQHLLTLLEQPISSAEHLLEYIENNLEHHTANTAQFDDMTMIAIKRKADKLE